MGKVVLSLMLMAALTVLASSVVQTEIKLEEHFENLSTQRFPNDALNKGREDAREYIRKQFQNYGLEVQQHTFNTSVRLDVNGLDYHEKIVEGVNMIGIVRAISDKPEAVIVVGADYDTNGIDDPFFNNGAGVAVLLDVARLYSFNSRWSGNYALNFTTVFVAYDLNTKEHTAGSGRPGGWYFLQEWLWPFLNQSDVNFGGAIILDSVMNVNYEMESQIIDNNFKEVFPETSKRVEADENKGNFLGVVTVESEKAIKLKDQFIGMYNKDRKRRLYRTEDMMLGKNVPLNKLTVELSKQESFHYWTFNPNNSINPLPAVLLTDTQGLRAMPPQPDSCVRACRPKDWLTEERMAFMESTTQGLHHFLLKRQCTMLPEVNSSGSFLPSLLTTALIMVIVTLLQ